MKEELETLIVAIREGRIDEATAFEELATLPFRDLGFARVDVHRELRQDAAEAILAEGKTAEEVVAIASTLLEAGAASLLVTRAGDEIRAALRGAIPGLVEDARARIAWVERTRRARNGLVTMISAGTSDRPVLREAQVRADLMGSEVIVHEDSGVAGLHRLAAALPDLRRADCVVVCAGMDGALASVVGGLVAVPVIGVPTSTGYGSAAGGQTALNAMLASCAAGLAVVGIDDGFGAGTVAAAIARSRQCAT